VSFRLVNALANPIVSAVLRSPLHRLASGGLMLITFTGRRTGTQHTIPVQYAHDDEGIVVAVGWAAQKRWWRNLRGGGEVELVVRGRRMPAHAEALTGAEDPVRVSAALARYLARFPKAAKDLAAVEDAVVVLVMPA
jgi:deazaflavin-dependent oxidoreductase (nitroreductase family)